MKISIYFICNVLGWPAGGQLRVWVRRVLRDAAGDVRRRGDNQHHTAAEPQVPAKISTISTQ